MAVPISYKESPASLGNLFRVQAEVVRAVFRIELRKLGIQALNERIRSGR